MLNETFSVIFKHCAWSSFVHSSEMKLLSRKMMKDWTTNWSDIYDLLPSHWLYRSQKCAKKCSSTLKNPFQEKKKFLELFVKHFPIFFWYQIRQKSQRSHSDVKGPFLFKNYKFLKSLKNCQFLFLFQNWRFLAVKNSEIWIFAPKLVKNLSFHVFRQFWIKINSWKARKIVNFYFFCQIWLFLTIKNRNIWIFAPKLVKNCHFIDWFGQF